jgi:predicted AAA+ superfamily ATPase
MEVTAYCSYFNRRYLLSYWRTASQLEVDLIVGDHLALEIKSTDRVHDRHLKGLRAFKEEHQVQGIVILRDPKEKKTKDNILILPWEKFLKRLWSHEIII